MDIEKRLEIITRNTSEILTHDDLKKLLETKNRPSAYIGIAVTGPFHTGYLVPFSKLVDFDRAGINTIVLIADLHGAMDDLKVSWEKMQLVTKYYQKCVELSFPWRKPPKFVIGSSYQLSKNYVNDIFKMSTISTVNRATRAASEVTRMKNPKVSELIYPIMQALDEEYLNVDIQLGGTDQRHILGFAREFLPKLGYKPRVEIMTPLTVGLGGSGSKMSASDPSSIIKVHDSEKTIKDRINKAYCPEGEVNNNPIIQICQYIVFPLFGRLEIKRPQKFGGDMTINSMDELNNIYSGRQLHPADLKSAVSDLLIKTFSKTRSYFDKNQILKKLGERFI